MTDNKTKLTGLFHFAEGVLSAKDAAVLRVQDYKLGLFTEFSLKGLPGIALNLEDDVWLSIERLRENECPKPPVDLRNWVADLPNDPNREPKWAEFVAYEANEPEINSLLNSGSLLPDDVHPLDDKKPHDKVKRIVLRLENLPHFQRQLSNWKENVWSPWALSEKRVRSTIAAYNNLFLLHSMMHGGGGAEPPELVWGIGLAKWELAQKIDMPLIEQLIDIEIEKSGRIVLRPRLVKPVLNLRPFIEMDVNGSAQAQQYLNEEFNKLLNSEDKPVTPFESSYWEGLLAIAASRLTEKGSLIARENVETTGGTGDPSKELRVYSSWVIYGRPRSESVRAVDLEMLRRKIEQTSDEEEIPSSLRGLVGEIPADAEGTSEFNWDPKITLIGPNGAAAEGNHETSERSLPEISPANVYFFPLPFNSEQSRIIDLLEKHDVVTVTGPPGTGKTHTIANIIAHQMAVGSRVLVTARTAEAIAAISEKLPEDLRGLVIASVGNDRESNRQLEEAVRRLSEDVTTLDPEAAHREIISLERQIVEIDKEMASCDRRLAEIARANFEQITWRERSYTPIDLPNVLAARKKEFEWLTDKPNSFPSEEVKGAIARLRKYLPDVGSDIIYAGLSLPEADELPSTSELLSAHRSESIRLAEIPVDASEQPLIALDGRDAEKDARHLFAYFSEFADAVAQMPHWCRRLLSSLLQSAIVGSAPPPTLRVLDTTVSNIARLEPGNVTYRVDDSLKTSLLEAAERGAAGGRASSLVTSLLNRKLSEALSSLKLSERAPGSSSDWRLVRDALVFDQARAAFGPLWKREADSGRLPSLPIEQKTATEVIRATADQAKAIAQARDELLEKVQKLKLLFPYGLDISASVIELDFEAIQKAFLANLPDLRPAPAAVARLEQFRSLADSPIYGELIQLRELLGKDGVSDRNIVEIRGAIARELVRIESKRDLIESASSDLATLQEGGAPNWAQDLRTSPSSAALLIPENWELAWEASLLSKHLESIIQLGNGEDLRQRKAELRRRREGCFADLIRQRALLGLKPRLTSPVKTALSIFTSAIQRLGKGTGQGATRIRKVIRQAAMDAAPAAPVWVVPEHRIAEQLPAHLAEFDLVVLDEASQSDVTAIAALARGKKLLIVGDAKQVTPANVGIPANKITLLRAQHLSKLPNAQIIDHNTSIFEIASQMYPSSHLMLREHFRCAEPIIRYSANRHYKGLLPIRIPLPSERLDPPLIDVFVRSAQRRGKTNQAEAEYIVNEIAGIVSDSSNEGRDIGVISLIGREQADKIQKMMLKDSRISASGIEKFRIICGDSRTMQGQERSIVFLSMVATPDNVVAQSTLDMDQRLNVAMSRAKDRLYLVRSVSKQDLSVNDLKLSVLEHVENPMPGGAMVDNSILDRCQSGFERDVCSRLIESMYRVRAQVRAGPYSIDLVVEGEDDRRLAIELDGDVWHGADRWESDMHRQAVLERAGWTFWRVFGSQWYSNPEHWWSQLKATLATLGITPLGSEASTEHYTDFRVFDPAPASGASGIEEQEEMALQ